MTSIEDPNNVSNGEAGSLSPRYSCRVKERRLESKCGHNWRERGVEKSQVRVRE